MFIFPTPKKEESREGSYTLKKRPEDKDLLSVYHFYCGGNEDLTFVKDNALGEDAYRLEIGTDGVSVVYGKESGKFRAVTSLRQLIIRGNGVLPCLYVEDAPDFERRGYMMDVSGARKVKLEFLKKFVDYLAELKYNELQLYMESFCFKYEAFPKYTADFDCIGPADIEELDAYCRERMIDLVPNQNGFGHLYTWLKQPEFSHLSVGYPDHLTGTINPLLPESLEFMDSLYRSLLPHFSSEYVHLGLDETFGLGKYQLEEICKEKGDINVFMDWLNKLHDHVAEKYGKKMMFWADMVYSHPEGYDRVPKDAIAVNWCYDLIECVVMESRARDIWEHGVTQYICPGNSNWISLTGRFDLANCNLRTAGEIGRKYHAKGYLITDWGNLGHPHNYVWAVVPGALAGLYSWNAGAEQNGNTVKNENILLAEEYCDTFFFGAKVSEHLRRMQQYYLLEPERLHCSTICGFSLPQPLSSASVPGFFDLEKSGSDFNFKEIIRYMKDALEEFEPVEFDENLKRQAILNAKEVIFSAELCLIRMHKTATNEKIDELVAMAEWIIKEHRELWLVENYERGVEMVENQIKSRRDELLAMKK